MDLRLRDIRVTNKVYDTLADYFGKNVVISDLSRSQLHEFIQNIWVKDKTYATANGYIAYINNVLKREKNINTFTSSDFIIKETIDNLITREELDLLVNELENPQDQFILYALFHGIYGKRAEELRYLTIDQVDLKKQTITLENRVVKMDKEFTEITASAIEQSSYYLTHFSNGARVEKAEFNMSCKYVIKQRMIAKNNNGLDVITYDGFRARLKKISKVLGFNVTCDSLVKSGYAYTVNQSGLKATYDNIERLKREHKMVTSIVTLYKTYHNIYTN